MSSNQDKILAWYSGGLEDNRHRMSRSIGMEFHYTKKFMSPYITPASQVIELGCATGYYGMYFADKCAYYTGVDMSPDNIEVFKSKMLAAGINNISGFVGDATKLSELSDESYDVVMCLGPMYHVPRDERLLIFAECRRIARKGAVIAFAYLNRLGVYAGACVIDKKYPNAEANKLVFEYNTGDEGTGVFFFTSPEEMEEDAAQCDLTILKNCGLDFFFQAPAIDAMSDEQFELYTELSDRMCDSHSCTGLANHALLICRK